jgi:hypothetical protein
MSANLKVAFITGSGALLDTVTSVTVTDTRILVVQSSGIGTFAITGVQTDERGGSLGSIIKYANTTAVDVNDVYLPGLGVRMSGPVKVSAPTSAATTTVFYG